MTIESLSAQALAKSQQANAVCIAARLALKQQEAECRGRENRLLAAKADLNRLLEIEKDDHVARILEGESSRPNRPKRRRRIENLKEEIEGLTLALPIMRGRIHTAKRALEAADENYANSVLPLVCVERSAALREFRERLSELQPLLVRMMAQDRVQDRLVGQSFVFTDPDVEVFSGQFVVRTLVEEIGDRLRPENWALGQLTIAADRMADDFTRAIKGDEQ